MLKFKEIILENFGPIEKGTIQRKKINVFIGPNNSGKSIVSRLIYGINTFDNKKSIPKVLKQRYGKMSNDDLLSAYMKIILNSAGFNTCEYLTYGKKSGCINIKSNKSMTLKFSKKQNQQASKSSFMFKRLYQIIHMNSKKSIYIPAGRTGMIQFFTNITRIRNRLLNEFLDTFGEYDSPYLKETFIHEIQTFTRTSSKLPQYLEQFHDLILDVQSDKLDINAKELFSELFEGSVDMLKRPRHSTVMYKDPTDFITDIESAGSGIVSSFPIIAGIYYVKNGGTLIIEEPEAQLEPSKQLKMLESLCDIAKTRDVDLVFTTHSDYIVKQLLAMVSSGQLKHADIGMYYFNRKPNKLTIIEKIKIDKTGEAEQEIFQDALDSLIRKFSQ